MSSLPLVLALSLAAPVPPPPALPAPAPAPASAGPLQGSWPSSGERRVKLDDDLSVDDAVTQICEAAGWNLVLDTGAAGDETVRAALRDAPAEEALTAVLDGSGLVAYREGNVVTVSRPGEPRLQGLSGASGKRIHREEDESIDDALSALGEAAGWNMVLHTGRAGDARVRLRWKDVPVELAVRALLRGTGLSASRTGSVVSVSVSGESLPPPRSVLEGFETPTGKLFSGDFDNTPADQAIRKLLDAAGLSVVMPRGSYRAVNGHFKDAAVEDALRAICAEAGLTATRRGTVVTVERGGPTLGSIPPVPNLPDLPGMSAQDREELQNDADEARRDAEEAAQEARKDAEEARREAQQDAEEARREAQQAAEDADPNRSGKDRVVTGDVTLGPGEHVRDLVALHGNAKLGPGARARDVTAFGGSVDVGPGAIVEHEATAVGGSVHVAPGARVGKAATALGGKVTVDPGAFVHSRESADVKLPPIPGLPGMPGPPPPPAAEHHRFHFFSLGWVVVEFAFYFALGLIVMSLWPRRLERIVQALRLTPARSTAVGLLGLIAIPLLAGLLFITIIGWLLLPVEALAVAVASVIGYTALAVLLGRKLPLKAKLTNVGQLAVGTAAITLITHIPVLGGAVAVVGWIVALGAVLSTRFGQNDPGDASTFPIDEAVRQAP